MISFSFARRGAPAPLTLIVFRHRLALIDRISRIFSLDEAQEPVALSIILYKLQPNILWRPRLSLVCAALARLQRDRNRFTTQL
jgi:hypothetical protein